MRSGAGCTRLRRFAPLVLATAIALIFFLYRSPRPTSESSLPVRDINQVLADHDEQLLAIPGVVGIAVALLADQQTPCLKVMLARDEKSLRESIPQRIEGHPVVAEVTGELRPLGQ